MKPHVKVLGIGIALFAVVTVYWNYQVSQKSVELTKVAQPFLAACKSDSGCLLSPPGWTPQRDAFHTGEGGEWVKTNDAASYLGQMEYVANRSDFELRWHIATDVYLVARGGAKTELNITRYVD